MKKKLTLLYVEDDIVARENFSEIFENYFHSVLTSDDGNEALKLYKENHVDVAILDISIKGMNGLNLAAKIRELSIDTIILILSAHSEKDKLLQALNLSLFGYLIKPVSYREIKTTLEKMLLPYKNLELITLSNNFFWNTDAHSLLYGSDEIKLTKKERKVIEILIKHKNNFLNACDIHEELFPNKKIPLNNCNNIVQLISRFKKKIAIFCKNDDFFIENCYGIGYKIVSI